jgi:hypothetical protein
MKGPIVSICGIAVLLFLVLGVVMYIVSFQKSESYTFKSHIEEYTPPTTDFKIYNYLQNSSIQVEVLSIINPVTKTTGTPIILQKEIRPKGHGGLSSKQVIDYLKPDNVLRIYTFPPGKEDEKIHYSDYVVATKEDERIKALHVGMITTRFIGEGYYLRDVTHAGNATNGMTWVVLHNLTSLPISLNGGKIKIAPHGTTRYLGTNRHDGVPLGTWFVNDDGLYPTYQYLQPYTDIYYGLTSDQQSAIASWIWEPEFSDGVGYGKDSSQTMWPFQEGIY